jgi:hypothetical protein
MSCLNIVTKKKKEKKRNTQLCLTFAKISQKNNCETMKSVIFNTHRHRERERERETHTTKRMTTNPEQERTGEEVLFIQWRSFLST